MYQEIDGDLITMASEGSFDVIAHGCNCFNKMNKGLALQMSDRFNCDTFPLEEDEYKGDINKLGNIDADTFFIGNEGKQTLVVLNCYTQFNYAKKSDPPNTKHIDYSSLRLCLKKINHLFKGKRIGFPKIGAGLAGGDWRIIKLLIVKELKDCDVTVVNYKE